jgi:hypothetical protein
MVLLTLYLLQIKGQPMGLKISKNSYTQGWHQWFFKASSAETKVFSYQFWCFRGWG